MYWLPRHGRPVLVGLMYRVPAHRRPAFGGRILAYHRHTSNGHPGATRMTHVWLAHKLRSAYARCLPVAALQRAIPTLRYAETQRASTHPESAPCTEI